MSEVDGANEVREACEYSCFCGFAKRLFNGLEGEDKGEWQYFTETLGMVNIFDIGCGAGDITERLYTEYAKGKINSYKGVDVFPHPEKWRRLSGKYKGLSFSKIASEEKILEEMPTKTNLVISQSSLEHIEKDLLVFKQIKKFVERNDHPVTQVHLIPSAACLWLYLFHGVRQYTPRTVSKITKLFKGDQCQLIALGGDECFKLQLKAFTKPETMNRFGLYRVPVFFKKWQGSNFNKIADDPELIKEYDKLARQAMKNDMNKRTKIPVFYALVIKSNY